LVSIGLVSFVIIAQLAPSFFGALFWKRGSKMVPQQESLLVFHLLLYTTSALCYWNNKSTSLFIQEGPWEITLLKPFQLG
jgi:Na+/proline symporter